jgi:ribonuclease HI
VTIQTILQWYHIPVAGPMQIKIQCDNQVVIRKIQARMKQRRTVNQFKIADVDVELQLMHKISELGTAGLRISIQQIQSRNMSKT